jgi:hypothetical protein
MQGSVDPKAIYLYKGVPVRASEGFTNAWVDITRIFPTCQEDPPVLCVKAQRKELQGPIHPLELIAWAGQFCD